MTRLVLVGTVCLFLVQSSVYSFNIDGDLSDWGVTPASDLTPNSGIFSWIEDYVDYSRNGYVGPAHGGQPYDVEALYVAIDSTDIHFAMVLGMPPGGSYSEPRVSNDFYYPGDLAFDLNGDGNFEYGVEITGRSDNTIGGSPENGDYSNDPSKIGNIYNVTNNQGWNKGLNVSGYTPTELNYRKSQYLNLVGTTTVAYVQSNDPEHYVVETSIPLAVVDYTAGSNWLFHWTMTCGNDIGDLNVLYTPYYPPSTAIPEPLSILLVSASLISLGIRKK